MSKNAEIVIILDSSGSMEPLRKDTIGSFNKFLNDQKELTKDTNITVLTFANDTRTLYSGSVKNAKLLTGEDYHTSGGTALNDAILQGLYYLETVSPKAAVMCIITDGEENASVIAKTQDIKSRIVKLQSARDWKFVYLGANVDAFKTGASMGLSGINTFNYAASSAGLAGAYQAATASTQTYLANAGNSSADAQTLKQFSNLIDTSNATKGVTIK